MRRNTVNVNVCNKCKKFPFKKIMDNLNEIKITCLCQSTIQTLYVGFILKSGFTKH